MTYELHPLCTLFPRMVGPEFDALVADIKANGLRSPIVLHQGMILDGGNRARACDVAGVEAQYIEFDGSSVVAFVLSANLHRRHMTPGQQAAIVALAQDWEKAQPRGGDRKSNQSATLHFDSAAKRASESGASVRTQKMADKLVKASPDLGRKVALGEKSLPAALRETDQSATLHFDPADKPAKAKKPATPSAAATDSAEVQSLRDQIDELTANLREATEDNESMARVFEADDKVKAAMAEAKRYRELNRILEERIAGLMNEKNAAIRAAKSWQRKAEAAERAAA